MDLASSLVLSGMGGNSVTLLAGDGVGLLGALKDDVGGDGVGARLATLSLPNLHTDPISLVTKPDLGVGFSRNLRRYMIDVKLHQFRDTLFNKYIKYTAA